MKISQCLALAVTALSLTSNANAAVVSAGDIRLPSVGYRLDFISIGAGINSKAYAVVVKELRARLATGDLREFTLVPWGREGERRVCFTLATPGAADAILAKAKITDPEVSLVHVESTDSCSTAP